MSATATSALEVNPISEDGLEHLGRWVIAFCIIRFDLEKGQILEECYPSGLLTHEEELAISFNSFPDSMSQSQSYSSIHDSMFFFRIPRRGTSAANSSPEIRNPGSRSSTYRSNFIYGYVFNRQRKDERLKRGGEQKSVVILSSNPYYSVFKSLLQILGPLCFDLGKGALEYAASFVSAWPVPRLGRLMELPIGNSTLKTYLPHENSFLLDETSSGGELSMEISPFDMTQQPGPQGLFFETDIFGVFHGLLLHLWRLWELLIIGEPLLIIAPTPSQCSEAVASLVNLVAPLPLTTDFRPYFTIHDPDFAYINSLTEKDPFPPMILGVTNLFFLRALQNVAHVVSVGFPSPHMKHRSYRQQVSSIIQNSRPNNLHIQQRSLKRFSPSSLLSAVKLKKDDPLSLMTEHREAIWSTYSGTTKPDISILNKLIDVGTTDITDESISAVNNEILKRHFFELTSNFLAPFGPYMRARSPLKGVSPFADPPPLPSFNAAEFMTGLAGRGPGKFLSKRMKANWLELYRRFLEGGNFMPWFQRKRAVAQQDQYRLWKQARVRSDIHHFLPKMSELEIVDSFNAIEQDLLGELQKFENGDLLCGASCQKLKNDLRNVFKLLPNDVQDLLLINPQRASLLEISLERI